MSTPPLPEEPTAAMLQAGMDALGVEPELVHVWRAMVAAWKAERLHLDYVETPAYGTVLKSNWQKYIEASACLTKKP